ncbi:TetR/AcrR family transcriptional regulator [Streptomyces sp. SP18BB07]|uniref:TetR/AcrR family transcriptional regulator n=1 Tax=Streptomyces sp. SP18BB07 TaxID=3002522 RepID=UPI002E76ED0F|nr:TetR/AcrR family transcriptional regulator [Streptomyces sp. SP18BB07]MEE1765176.1 TetR/AcrR family transcriptional regulator [Streptomyces sp. SP18BB07]
MTEKTAARRADRRRARTRSALVRAAQRLLAEGRSDIPIQEITELADVGVGSFYNHFDTKEDLFRVAVEEVLEWFGDLMDRLTADIDDPAVAYAQSFRMTGRLHRRFPQLSLVLLNHGLEVAYSDRGLAPRALRDIRTATDAGRFEVEDLDLALAMTVSAQLALGSLLHAQSDRDDAYSSDLVARGLLRHFGIPADEAARICSLDLPDIDLGDTVVG